MDTKHPKCFDYLDEYGETLQADFNYPDLISDIDFARRRGFENPKLVLTNCRIIIEAKLNSILNKANISLPKTIEAKIKTAEKKNLISDDESEWFEAIRLIGNCGGHPSHLIEFDDAQECMKLLDTILRYEVSKINEDVDLEISVDYKSLFFLYSEDELDDFENEGILASNLSHDDSFKETSEKVKEEAEKQNASISDFGESINKYNKEQNQVEENFGLSEETEAERPPKEEDYEKLVNDARETETHFLNSKNKITEVIGEYDFIEKLLKGEGKATKDQMDIMAFPESSSSNGAKSPKTVLEILGGAGTGKTLCLLAKVIKEIEDDIKASARFNRTKNRPKKGLFVCFNKPLKKYVEELLGNYPRARQYIDVERFDYFVNQFVKPDHSNYPNFANDVRYPASYQISYPERSPESRMGNAMKKVSTKYPDQAYLFCLDNTNIDNVAFMYDEINWLEARYKDPEEARKPYLIADRIGLRTDINPNKNERKIILEVWRTYRELLEQAHRYTLEQAVKRLVRSESLPSYDFIAVDEIQDFSLSSIRLLRKFMHDQQSRMFVAGDEDQKIYRRDFTLKELHSEFDVCSVRLYQNMRNSPSIKKFADRLLGVDSPLEDCSKDVRVSQGSSEDILKCICDTAARSEESTVLIGSPWEWESRIKAMGLPWKNPIETNQYGRREQRIVNVIQPGLYVFGDLSAKGLEFDNVIIADMQSDNEDEEEEKRLRNVHFTRARKRLYIFYESEPPELLQKYYPDFL